MTSQSPCPESFKDVNLEYIVVGNYSALHTDSLEFLFKGCAKLRRVEILGFATSHIKNYNGMFDGCISLEDIDLEFLNTSSAEKMDYMFVDCKSLRKVDISDFSVAKLQSMTHMFDGCTSLESINMQGLDLACTDISNMFNGCENLNQVILYGCNEPTVKKVIEEYWFTFHRVIKFNYDEHIEIDISGSLTKLTYFKKAYLNNRLTKIPLGPKSSFVSELAAYRTFTTFGKDPSVGEHVIIEIPEPLFCEKGQTINMAFGDYGLNYMILRLDKIIVQFTTYAIVEVCIIKIGSIMDFVKQIESYSNLPNFYKSVFCGPNLCGTSNPRLYIRRIEDDIVQVSNTDLGGDATETYTIYTDQHGFDHLVDIAYLTWWNESRFDFGDLILGPHKDCPWLGKLN